MKTLVFGSLNIDRTYSVDHLVSAGETLSARGMEAFCGGKGFNQAIALRRAGCTEVFFAGAVGTDGGMLLDALDRNGIDRSHVRTVPGTTGHAIIQVDRDGQNSIIILAGANGAVTPEDVQRALADFSAGDLIVLQNEITCVPELLHAARARGMIIAFNPSPCNEKIAACDLGYVDYLLINETEGQALSGTDSPTGMLDALRAKWPHTNIVLTLGDKGSVYQGCDGRRISGGIYPVKAVDTTAAGDTFTGYFLNEMLICGDPVRALRAAAVAAGLAVSRKGAEPSIPLREAVLAADPALR